MTTKPKTRKASARAPGVNPTLIALAAKIDKAEAKFNRAIDVLGVADQKFFRNREDAAAQAAQLEAESAEGAACDATERAAEKFSKVRATNLEELILKARYCDVDFIDDVVALSIIRDLRARGGKPMAKASKEAEGNQHARHS